MKTHTAGGGYATLDCFVAEPVLSQTPSLGEGSEAEGLLSREERKRDCFVTLLLAMKISLRPSR